MPSGVGRQQGLSARARTTHPGTVTSVAVKLRYSRRRIPSLPALLEKSLRAGVRDGGERTEVPAPPVAGLGCRLSVAGASSTLVWGGLRRTFALIGQRVEVDVEG